MRMATELENVLNNLTRFQTVFTSPPPKWPGPAPKVTVTWEDAKWTAAKGVANVIYRAQIARSNVIPLVFKVEPARIPRAMEATDLSRWWFANALNRTGDIITWATDYPALLAGIRNILVNDATAGVRIQMLEALLQAAIPVAWGKELLATLDDAEKTMSVSYFDPKQRQKLSSAITTLRSRLITDQNEAVQQQLPALPALPENVVPGSPAQPAVPGGTILVLPPRPRTTWYSEWKPWAALGGAVLFLGGIAYWAKRRASGEQASSILKHSDRKPPRSDLPVS